MEFEIDGINGYMVQNVTQSDEVVSKKVGHTGRNLLGLLPVMLLILLVVLRISWTLYRSFGQKTRSQQPRRMYGAARPRDSLGSPPTVYVSPSNLPPPPKYDFAPPSYEEVVGVHYPHMYAAQPISQPITTALANQTSQSQGPSRPATDMTSVTVINEPQRTSVTVARS